MVNRMREYIDYHINGDSDCNAVILREWANAHSLNLQNRFDLAYFFSVTYCVPCAISIFQCKNEILKDIDKWVSDNKKYVIFQSDRKYVRMLDNFNKCIKYYSENLQSVDEFLDSITVGKTTVLKKALNKIQHWFFFGRFASYLFLETFIALTDFNIVNTTIDWKNGDTATSGIMNVFGLDNSANFFDKTNKIPKKLDYDKLNNMLFTVQLGIKERGGDDNVTGVETSLCAYRKFFKGSRYNGFYLDRQLEELLQVKKFNKKYITLTEELFRIRKRLFSKKYLGELNNWSGVRKECKKLYKSKGIMM